MKKIYYAQFKSQYDGTKPIRGRAVEARPIGKRRRDWELIEMDGDVVACRLYNTQVVRYYPDGNIGLRCDNWQSPSTAEFVHMHSPWTCYKRNKKLWVMVPNGDSKYMHYPIPKEGELIFQPTESGGWEPISEIVIEKQVVNRKKAKEVRTPYQPFLTWAKTFLKLSDGWIMHETRKQAIPMKDHYFHYRDFTEPDILEMAKSGDDEKFLTAMCALLYDTGNTLEYRVAEKAVVEPRYINGVNMAYAPTYFDMRFSYDLLKSRLYRMLEKVSDIHDRVRVGVSDKAQCNVF